MSGLSPTRWAVAGARTIAGATVAAVVVLAAGVSVIAPWPLVTHTPVSIAAVPTPADTIAVCDGQILAAGRAADSAGQIGVAAAQVPTVGAEVGNAQPLALRSPDVRDSARVSAFSAAPSDGAANAVVAAASSRLADADLAGLTADACRPPLFDSWLVGGSTTTGWSDLVVISNPGDVAATVDITVFGATGPTVPPGGSGVTIGARAQRVIPLAGIALGEESPVLRISATGAPVRASLQSSLVRTLVAGGVDQQTAIATPAQTQVIPGVVVTAAPGEVGASDPATILRVLAPSVGGQATVTVTAVGGKTPVVPVATVPLSAGIASELDLGGLPKGSYVITVAASASIVAAVWQTTGFGAGADYAWLTSAPPVDGPTLVAVPAGPSPALHLANSGAVDATVVLHILDGVGTDRTVLVPAGGSAAVSLTPRSVWSIDPGGGTGIHAQVMLVGANAIAGFAVWPSESAVARVQVYP